MCVDVVEPVAQLPQCIPSIEFGKRNGKLIRGQLC